VKLHLKFADDADDRRRREVTEHAGRLGALAVRPLFPDGATPTMRSMYIVDLADDADAARVTRTLRGHDAVESVDEEFRRSLAV
jgi:hypothetical protein